MNNKLGIYEKAMPENFTIGQKLQLAKSAGFDYMEISIDETQEKLNRIYSKDITNKIKEFCFVEQFKINTMCLSAHRKYPLGSLNKQTREKSIDILQNAVNFSLDIGIRIIQLAGYDVYYEENCNDTEKYFLENLSKCVDIAAKNAVLLAFETMETPFMNTIEKAKKYVDIINSPYLQIYPDIGNISNATEDLAKDIKKGKGHIVAAHLKETKKGIYRNLIFGQGKVDFDLCIKELKKQGVGMFTCEMWYDKKSDALEFIKNAKTFFEDKI